MKKLIALVMVMLFAVALPILAADTTTKPADPKKTVVKGVISAIDEKADTFTVKDETGKDHQFVLSGKWKPNVKQGEMVAVHYQVEGNKNVVTSIVPAKHVQKGGTAEAEKAAPAPAPAPAK